MERDFIIDVSPQFCVFVAAMVLLLPLPWLVGLLLAAMVHETFHCLTLLACGRKIYHISVGVNGAKIYTDDLSWGETVVCSLAGPMGGFLLVKASKVFPQLAVCGLLQSVYNMLPVFPLDGGRALQGIAHLLLSDLWACRFCRGVEYLTLLLLISLGLLSAFVWHLGLLPLILALIFALRVGKRKRPCK